MRRMRLAAFECGVAGVALLSILSMDCSRSNNLVLGRVTMRFAPTYGDLLGRILSSGRSVSTMDLLIATAAVMDGAPLVTANRKYFSVVPELSVISY